MNRCGDQGHALYDRHGRVDRRYIEADGAQSEIVAVCVVGQGLQYFRSKCEMIQQNYNETNGGRGVC